MIGDTLPAGVHYADSRTDPMDEPLHPEEEHHIALSVDSRRRGVCWDRLLFSAKESVYKTWFPLAERYLSFEHTKITWAAPGVGPASTSGGFRAELLVEGPWPTGRWLPGRWSVRDGPLCTSIVLPAASRIPVPTNVRSSYEENV
ncbi:4'-phosphopantetheinyl transferase superfamily protein [Streptomyces sp. NPDC048680]|uniref:4'-phosphopantetheinyl transferase superfamily protein n=1 Tax=Streptomyces sp. NPDC048680 TaxID=3155492 RepID=UPI0034332B41